MIRLHKIKNKVKLGWAPKVYNHAKFNQNVLSGSNDEIKEHKWQHDLINLIYLFSNKESSLKSFPCKQLSTMLRSRMEYDLTF
jgi:hypothetical protein